MENFVYTTCARCSSKVLLDDAFHAEGLVGHFCSESCVIACFREHTYIIPFPRVMQLQMGTTDELPGQIGRLDEKVRQDTHITKRGYEGNWQ